MWPLATMAIARYECSGPKKTKRHTLMWWPQPKEFSPSPFLNLIRTQSIRHVISNILPISSAERNSELPRSNSVHFQLAPTSSLSKLVFHPIIPLARLAFSKVVIHACKSGVGRRATIQRASDGNNRVTALSAVRPAKL